MNKIIKNTALYTIGNILPQAVAFFLLPLYSRHLSPEQYGIVSSMQVLQVMLAILFSFCLDRSIIRLFWDYKTEDDQKKFLGTITLTMIVNSLFVLIIIFLLRNVIQQIFSDIPFKPFYAYAIVTTFFMTFALVPKNYFRLQNQAGKYVLVSLAQMFLNVGFIIWFMVINKEGAEGMLKGKMFASLALLPFFLIVTLKHIKFTFNWDILKQSLSFSLPIIPTLIAAWALGQFDRILIAKYFTLNDVGIFSMSKRIAGLVGMFSGSFMLAYHPIFFELANSKDQTKAKRKLYKYNNVYILVLTVFVFFLIFFSKEIIQLFLDSRYFEAYRYIPLVALSLLITSVSSTVIGASFQQSKKMKADMIIGVSAAAFTVIMGYIFIKPYGINGAIGVTLLSSIYIFTNSLIYAKRKCYEVLVNWKIIIANFVILAAVYMLSTLIKIDNIILMITIKTAIILLISYFYFRKYRNEILLLMGRKKRNVTK